MKHEEHAESLQVQSTEITVTGENGDRVVDALQIQLETPTTLVTLMIDPSGVPDLVRRLQAAAEFSTRATMSRRSSPEARG
jgi:hypothetical protein